MGLRGFGSAGERFERELAGRLSDRAEAGSKVRAGGEDVLGFCGCADERWEVGLERCLERLDLGPEVRIAGDGERDDNLWFCALGVKRCVRFARGLALHVGHDLRASFLTAWRFKLHVAHAGAGPGATPGNVRSAAAFAHSAARSTAASIDGSRAGSAAGSLACAFAIAVCVGCRAGAVAVSLARPFARTGDVSGAFACAGPGAAAHARHRSLDGAASLAHPRALPCELTSFASRGRHRCIEHRIALRNALRARFEIDLAIGRGVLHFKRRGEVGLDVGLDLRNGGFCSCARLRCVVGCLRTEVGIDRVAGAFHVAVDLCRCVVESISRFDERLNVGCDV